jgi:Na+-transporting NADH:ubiquinone oxidoreductase subunit C
MAFSTTYIVGFAAGVCVLCSIGIATASMGLRDLQLANERKALQEKVLSAVGLPEPGPDGRRPVMSAEEVDKLFTDRLKLIVVDLEGKEVLADKSDEEKRTAIAEARLKVKGTSEPPALSPVYLKMAGQTVEAYTLEVQGKGLWGPISGYLALKPDAKTLMSVAFDAPKETPGLGGEIIKPLFQDQWKDKTIVSADGALVPIDVVKGSAVLGCPGRVQHCVDGVSGATITARGVDEMVDQAISKNYASYLKRIQAGG